MKPGTTALVTLAKHLPGGPLGEHQAGVKVDLELLAPRGQRDVQDRGGICEAGVTALLTRMSTRPKALIAASNARSAELAAATSA